MYICLTPATYFLSVCPIAKNAVRSEAHPLKRSMLKVNLLFIVKKTWFRQPLNGEYVTLAADRSSQQRPANITTFGEPLAQPSDVS